MTYFVMKNSFISNEREENIPKKLNKNILNEYKINILSTTDSIFIPVLDLDRWSWGGKGGKRYFKVTVHRG